MTLMEWIDLTERRGETTAQIGARNSPGGLTFWEAWKDRTDEIRFYDRRIREYTYYTVWDGDGLILMTDDLYRARRTWVRSIAFLYPEAMGHGPVDAERIWSEFSNVLHLVEEASG